MPIKLTKYQYGGRLGVGTEHLIVNFIYRVLKMLNSTGGQAAVIAAAGHQHLTCVGITQRRAILSIYSVLNTEFKEKKTFRNFTSRPKLILD